MPDKHTDKHTITIEISEAVIGTVTDETLAFWWSAAQHNPADGFADPAPGRLAMLVGWEIIRRWLKGIRPELYHHQQSHYYWRELASLGEWRGGREFRPHVVPPNTRIVRDALREAAGHVKFSDPGKAREYAQALEVLETMQSAGSGTPVPETEVPRDGH